MTLGDKLAEAIANRIKPENVVERLGISVNKEIVRQVKETTNEQIEEIVQAHLSSSEFMEQYKQIIKQQVGEYVAESLPQYAPVLILEGRVFQEYKKNYELYGPIATINIASDETEGEQKAYVQALDEVKKQAREMGGHVVEILEKESTYDVEYSDYYEWTIIGNLYINKGILEEKLKTESDSRE